MLVGGVVCGCSPKAAVLAPTAPKVVANKTVAVVQNDDPKDENQFVQHAGQTRLTKLAPGAASVVARLVTRKATYVLLKAHHEATLDAARLESVTDATGRELVAAASGAAAFTQSMSAPDYELILRIPASSALQDFRTITWKARRVMQSAANEVAGGFEQTLTVPAIEQAPVNADLETRFGEAMAAWFDEHGQGSPFMSFAAARLMRQLVKGVPEQNPRRWRWQGNRTELRDLMDFYTGRSTVRDSLQIERGLQLPAKAAPHTLNPASLRIAPPRDRDYEQLVAADSPQGTPVISPLSSVVPADSLVVEFSSLKDVIQLPRLLDQKLGQVLRIAEGMGGPNHLIEHYRKQLAIELDGFAETVGQFAVKSVCVALSDPYLREGTDITLVFRAENPSLLAGVLANHLARAKTRHPNLVSTQETLLGETVGVNLTPDAAVSRFEYAYGEYRILSNSRGAIGRMIQVKQGKLARLSQDKGYLGARSLSPFNAERERAFVFFGDAFVASVVGPRSRILEARRMRAQAELEAVDHGALLAGWLEGKAPTTVAELINSGWVNKADLVHSDGSKIDWSPNAGAHSRWGYAKTLVPIVDLPFDKIGTDEATAYQAFRSRYDSDMNGILDPTSLRFEKTGADEHAIHSELRVFPIMARGQFQSKFRDVTRLTGVGRVEPGAITRGLSATLGVGKDSWLRDMTDDTIHDFLGTRELSISFVGDWVRAGLDEGTAIWDFASHEHSVMGIEQDTDHEYQRLDYDKLVPRLPVWVAIDIKSRLLLAAAITALRSKIEKSAHDSVKWQNDTSYREIPVTKVRVTESDAHDAAYVNVYYAVAKDVFLISLRRDVLNARIDEVLEGRTPKGARLPQSPSQLVMDFAPLLGGWQRSAAYASLDTLAMQAHERACVGLETLMRGLPKWPDDPLLRRELALRLIGFEPESPQGGALNRRNGVCEHPVYGSPVEPRAPDAKDPNVPLHGLLSSIGSLRFALGLVPRGNAMELWGRFELDKGNRP